MLVDPDPKIESRSSIAHTVIRPKKKYVCLGLHRNSRVGQSVGFIFYFLIYFYFQNSQKTPKKAIGGRGSHFHSILRKGIEDIRRKQLLRTVNTSKQCCTQYKMQCITYL